MSSRGNNRETAPMEVIVIEDDSSSIIALETTTKKSHQPSSSSSANNHTPKKNINSYFPSMMMKQEPESGGGKKGRRNFNEEEVLEEDYPLEDDDNQQPVKSANNNNASRKRSSASTIPIELSDEEETEHQHPSSSSRRKSATTTESSSSSSSSNKRRKLVLNEQFSLIKTLDSQLTFDYETAMLDSTTSTKLTKQAQKFQSQLTKEAQEQCIQTIARLFLFKGTHKEMITRTQILETLSKIELEYKSYVDIILEKVQERLLMITGYLLIQGSTIKGLKEVEEEKYKGDYYLVNTLDSSLVLKKILTEAAENHLSSSSGGGGEGGNLKAFQGFSFLVFHCIFNAAGGMIPVKDLLRNLRKADSRFPESISKNTSSSSSSSSTVVPIKELGDDFLGLLNRLKKVNELNALIPYFYFILLFFFRSITLKYRRINKILMT